jgi:hypothetical protein
MSCSQTTGKSLIECADLQPRRIAGGPGTRFKRIDCGYVLLVDEFGEAGVAG